MINGISVGHLVVDGGSLGAYHDQPAGVHPSNVYLLKAEAILWSHIQRIHCWLADLNFQNLCNSLSLFFPQVPSEISSMSKKKLEFRWVSFPSFPLFWLPSSKKSTPSCIEEGMHTDMRGIDFLISNSTNLLGGIPYVWSWLIGEWIGWEHL